MHLLFVYGTLRRGQGHHAFLTGARFVGPAVTAPRYSLRIVGASAGLARNGRQAVVGEVYSLTDEHLARIDRLAGPGRLDRVEIALDNGREVFSYVIPERHVQHFVEVPDGDWVAWRRRTAGPSPLTRG
jgi:gamma-glutamylcyclotransferase (GGCT)/AIG2-like uncharacterized protein YtfP